MGKIKINPSTGKVLVSRDSAGNSKLCSTCCGQIPSVCGFCQDTQPAIVQINFSDFVDVGSSTCVVRLAGFAWAKYPIGIAALLNGLHDLDHISGCLYHKNIGIDYDFTGYTNNDCSAGASGENATILRIAAAAFVDHVQVTATFSSGSGSTIFNGFIFYDSGESCLNSENAANNEFVGGPCASGGVNPATGVAAIVV